MHTSDGRQGFPGSPLGPGGPSLHATLQRFPLTIAYSYTHCGGQVPGGPLGGLGQRGGGKHGSKTKRHFWMKIFYLWITILKKMQVKITTSDLTNCLNAANYT